MTHEDLLKTITHWRSVHAENPQEFINFLIYFSEKLNNDGIEYAAEVADLDKKNQTLLKKIDSFVLVIEDLRNALNELHDAHSVSWFGNTCRCESHQKAYGVLMNVALWINNHKSGQEKTLR